MKNYSLKRIRNIGILALIFWLPVQLPAVTIVADYSLDGPSEGFNDPTDGAARQFVMQEAMDIWSAILDGSQTIIVQAAFDPLGGTPTSATLGQAGPEAVWANDGGGMQSNTYYVSALANQLTGSDLDLGFQDINAQFNSDVDGGFVLGSVTWYYGIDGNPGGDIDFLSTALHEIGHGLGFLDLIDSGTGAWCCSPSPVHPDIYGRQLTRPGFGDFDSMTNGQRLSAITSDNVFWKGPFVVAAVGGQEKMYAPSPYEPGSSVAHWDDDALPPALLMEPFATVALITVDITDAAFRDLGYTLLGPAPTPTVTPIPTTPTITPTPIPTTSQWGIIALSLMLMTFGAVLITRRKTERVKVSSRR